LTPTTLLTHNCVDATPAATIHSQRRRRFTEMNTPRVFRSVLALFLALISVTATAAGATLWGMGRSYSGALGPHGSDFIATPTPLGNHVRSAGAGLSHTIFLTDDGSLWGVGSNQFGQLGLGASRLVADTPERLATGVVAAAAGSTFTLFLTSDRTLWGVGGNTAGNLGDGTTVLRYKPVRIAANVVAMAGGYSHTLYVTADGTAQSATPVQFSGHVPAGTEVDVFNRSWINIPLRFGIARNLENAGAGTVLTPRPPE